jgi:SnoaL-like domain
MEQSAKVRETMLRFYDRLSAGDVESFDELVSREPATLVIGTAPGERANDRAGLRFGFEAEGVRIEAGDPLGYEEGSMGWVVDEPTFFFPDGSGMHTRLTAVMRWEDGRWKLVHMHVSVGVPDEEVVELQKRWSSGEAFPT